MERQRMSETKPAAAGLRGIAAGTTAICTVGAGGDSLRYRGYDVEDLAEHAVFEEVAYLLLYGKLPNRCGAGRLPEAACAACAACRAPLKDVLERIPGDDAPDGRAAHGRVDAGHARAGGRLFATRIARPTGCSPRQPSMLGYWHRFATEGERIETATDDPTIAGARAAPAHGQAAQRRASAVHGGVAHPVRRARVQRLDVHGARDRRRRCRTCTRRSPAPSAPCAARCTAAPTRRRWS